MDYQDIGYLRPVTAFVTTRKETDPPITALMKDFRMFPGDLKGNALPKVRRRPPKIHNYLVPAYMSAFANRTSIRPKTRDSADPVPSEKENPTRALLRTAQCGRMQRTASTSAIQHNKEVIYNLHPSTTVGVKDVAWQREIRKSPYHAHPAMWKRQDEDLLKKTVSTGNLRLFLQDGSEVKGGKAVVKVCYNYCHSCSARRSGIQVQLGS